MIIQNSVLAATAILGYDLLRDVTGRQVGFPRILRKIALRGSAAGGDTHVRVMVGTNQVAALYNDTTGFPSGENAFEVGAPIPANAEISVLVDDAPATNPINVHIETLP